MFYARVKQPSRMGKRGYGFFSRKLLGTRFFTILLALGVVFFMVNLVRMMSRDSDVRSDIARLDRDTERLEAEYRRLEDLRNFYKTDFFLEQETRKSLGYVKAGEHVVVIEGAKTDNARGGVAAELSNPQKWWKYLFGPRG